MAERPLLYERTLEETPTWAVAVVCFVLVLVSIVIENLIHLIDSWLRKRHKRSLYEALEKIKEVCGLPNNPNIGAGTVSLLLTVTQDRIANICIPKSVGNSWTPCGGNYADKEQEGECAKGKVPFVSAYGVNELNVFIFVLALFHVLYCNITLGLGTLKMRKWKTWEDETKTLEYQNQNDLERIKFARETSFGRRHMDFWSHSPFLLWIVCFFRQFFTSVTKVDYLTLRHGFVTAHLTPQSEMDFDFRKYISRSVEEDFKVVVGISPIIWLFAVLFLLTNTHGYSYLWLPFIPLIILLVVGAKLQVIITKMGLRIQERGDVVQPGDDLFWFNRPRLLLFLIHIILFTYEFGLNSCFNQQLEVTIIRPSMGLVIQVLCSYVTLPLYALTTQMGSTIKPAIFKEQVPSSTDSRQSETATRMPFSSQSGTPLHGMSPVHLLNGYRDSSAVDNSRQISSRKSDADMMEGWNPEIAGSHSPIRHHDDGEESRMSGWNDQVGDEIGKIGSTQREVRINMSDFSNRQNHDCK